jgi:outer membrane protein insertion porin family
VGARLGLATPFGSTVAVPASERFFAGGSNTVRGYGEHRLGPVDARGNPTGGAAQLIFNLEWRFPIWRWVSGAVFFDAGQVFAEAKDLSLTDLKPGTGGGIRLITPVGPVRLDVAYPLAQVPDQVQKWRTYFSVGFPF